MNFVEDPALRWWMTGECRLALAEQQMVESQTKIRSGNAVTRAEGGIAFFLVAEQCAYGLECLLVALHMTKETDFQLKHRPTLKDLFDTLDDALRSQLQARFQASAGTLDELLVGFNKSTEWRYAYPEGTNSVAPIGEGLRFGRLLSAYLIEEMARRRDASESQDRMPEPANPA